MRWRWIIPVVALLIGLLSVGIVSAHATLVKSVPAANAALPQAPDEIRLWFTENVEPSFSGFALVDSTGKTVATPPSQIDSTDAKQLYMRPGKLPDGLYTVAWHTVSADDGHALSGNFAFIIGAGSLPTTRAAQAAETIPADGTVIRWLNLLAMSLAMGSIGFLLFVWMPFASTSPSNPAIERRMIRLVWLGWISLGVVGVLALLLQVSLAAQVSIAGAITSPALGQVISGTRYGSLWVARMILWVLLGLELFMAAARHNRLFYWLALLFGAAILLTNSLYSHASAAPDVTAAVLDDWFHLLLTALWVGGLVQFVNVIGPVRKAFKPPEALLGTLVAYFSNFARVVIVGLLLTGLYSAWLEIGSFDALFGTLYGRVLLVKLALIVPLLALGGFNLVFTSRGLESGQAVWSGRLRFLIAGELVLAVAILGAVGAMTSLETGRTTLIQQAVAAAVPVPIVDSRVSDDLHVQLSISPGQVGQNNFTVSLSDANGKPVTDASLIRLRFDDQTTNLGESELRIDQSQATAPNATGTYSVAGANLSQAGKWRIRTSIQRPGQYDAVIDFTPQVAPAPAAPSSDVTIPANDNLIALLLIGLVMLIAGGAFALRSRMFSGGGLLSRGLMIVGAVLLATGALTVVQQSNTSGPSPSAQVACAGIDTGTPGNAIAADASSAPPSIRITSPSDGATIKGGEVDLQVATTNLTIDSQQHIHTYLDGQIASMDYSDAVKLQNVPPGIHDVCVVVSDASHVDTALHDGIRVIVQAP